MRITYWTHIWPMAERVEIARGVITEQPSLQVRIDSAAETSGRGEACGVGYAGETPASMGAQITALDSLLPVGLDRQQLLGLLPAGGARHAVDAALWDLEAKTHGRSAFDIAGLKPAPVLSARTIGMRSLADYAQTAERFADHPWLKVKVGAHQPIEAVRAVAGAARRARLIVDANQSWSVEQLKRWAPVLADLGVQLLEQPIAVGAEHALDGWRSPVPLCADELIDTAADLAKARGRFAAVNIKLDKVGGLTSALRLADEAQQQGFDLMVGCMGGSSLSMAPAMVLAQRCRYVDLDGPLVHGVDMDDGFVYVDGTVQEPSKRTLWG